MIRFVLTLGASVVEFTPLSDNGAYPFLVSVGNIRIGARAGATSGFGSTETPTGSVRLQNAARRVATLIGNPLRASAQIYNEDELAFAGFVSAISYGLMIDLTLES